MHWEWFYGWHTTFAHYFPKYLLEEDPCINSFFATNVPYNFPTDVMTIRNNLFRKKPRKNAGDDL